MNTPIVQWGPNHLKATVLASLTSQTAMKISLRKSVGKEEISDEKIAQMMQQVQSTLDLADRTVTGKNLDIVITVENTKTLAKEVIRSKYDNISQDRTKLQSTGRKILNWFPINFKSYAEWEEYAAQLKENFLTKKQVLA